MTARPAPIVRFTVVESTQTTAFDLAAEGAVDGTVVVADHQSAGRGRRGRTWTDAPGTSLLASILVRPRVPPSLLGTFSIATGVAVAEALRRATVILPPTVVRACRSHVVPLSGHLRSTPASRHPLH